MILFLSAVLLCSPLQHAMFSLYRVENGHITTERYGVSEVCDFAMKEGSDDLKRICQDYEAAGCGE